MQCRNGHISERNKFGACRECLREADKRWRIRHPEKHVARARKWDKENPERRRENERNNRGKNREKINNQQKKWRMENPGKMYLYRRKYYENNKELFDRLRKKWAKNNPQKIRDIGRIQQAARRACMPKWVDKKIIKEIYLNCPDGYHVDHIVPIKGKTVCGLHVPWNLQFLTKSENSRKGNKFEIV